MIKTLSQALRMDKERFKVPKSVQQAIPIQRIWPDGIFQQGTKFSKTYRFTDINYYIASKDNKTEMFLDYSELLNSLDSGISAKITINNRRINKEEFEKSILLPMKEDGLDHYREEYNEMLLSKITGTNNSIYQERYLTVSVHKRSIDDARTYFARIGTDIVTHLAKLSSTAEGLDAESRLQIFRDFFKGDVPQAFPFDLKQFAKKGTSFKDWMCPDSMEFERDHFKIGDRYGRVLYMQDYASYVKDDMISELCDFSRNLILSIDILPVPTDEAVREIQNRLLGVETNVTNWQRRQNANNNFSAIVPYDMELQRKETVGFRYGIIIVDSKKASVPDGNIKVAASGRTQYSASLRTAKDQCPAYIDNGINGCFNPVPYTGNPAAGRYLLWAECSQQEPSGSRPEETDEWKQFPVGRQWIRKELFGKRRDCASGIEYR